jgi:hypothetical protein
VAGYDSKVNKPGSSDHFIPAMPSSEVSHRSAFWHGPELSGWFLKNSSSGPRWANAFSKNEAPILDQNIESFTVTITSFSLDLHFSDSE